MVYSSITDPIKIKYAYKVNKNISEDYPDDWNVPPAAVVAFILVLNKQTNIVNSFFNSGKPYVQHPFNRTHNIFHNRRCHIDLNISSNKQQHNRHSKHAPQVS